MRHRGELVFLLMYHWVFLFEVFLSTLSDASARKKYALGEAAVRPDAGNPSRTPLAPGASGYWLHMTVDAVTNLTKQGRFHMTNSY